MKKLKAIQVDLDKDGEYVFDTDPLLGNEITSDYWTSNGQYYLQDKIEYPDVTFAMYCKGKMQESDLVELRSAWKVFCPN